MNTLDIPLSEPIDAKIRIPGSKSLTNRAILIASLAEGTSRLSGVLHSDDTRHMMTICGQLGVSFRQTDNRVSIKGCAGNLAACDSELYVENAGTAARFLTAILPLGKGEYLLTGNERMQQRPIADLIKALGSLGADVTDINGTGCPPVRIRASGLKGGRVEIPGDKSSQYISAVMMAAPYADRNTEISIIGELVSRTYVEMTERIMREFGVVSQWTDRQTIAINAGQPYQSCDYEIEGDASSASYFFGMAAVTGGRIRVEGLRPDSTQGDLGLLNILEGMGCRVTWDKSGVTVQGGDLRGIDVDMNSMSDVAPTLAVIALFAKGKTRISNVANMRIKECDRISAVVKELGKLGARVEEWEDGLSVNGGGPFNGAELDTYDDHRMAMSLSLAGLRIAGVKIRNPSCVSKTFPGFYDMFLPLIQ